MTRFINNGLRPIFVFNLLFHAFFFFLNWRTYVLPTHQDRRGPRLDPSGKGPDSYEILQLQRYPSMGCWVWKWAPYKNRAIWLPRSGFVQLLERMDSRESLIHDPIGQVPKSNAYATQQRLLRHSPSTGIEQNSSLATCSWKLPNQRGNPSYPKKDVSHNKIRYFWFLLKNLMRHIKTRTRDFVDSITTFLPTALR